MAHRYYNKELDIKLGEGKHTYCMKEMFEFFKKIYPDLDVNYNLFSEIIKRYNKLLVEQMLEGQYVPLGSGLGAIQVKKKERKFNRMRIDWGETNKLKAQGINKHVYFTDDVWVRFSWYKHSTKLINKTVYKFVPTKGPNGNSKRLARKIKTDPFALENFRY